MIKAGGAMLSPKEFQEVVDRAPEVRYTLALGLPHAKFHGTEVMVLVVEVRPGEVQDPAARRALLKRLQRSVFDETGHRPWDIILVAPRTIPQTANGKLRHAELRRRLIAEELGSGAVLSRLRVSP